MNLIYYFFGGGVLPINHKCKVVNLLSKFRAEILNLKVNPPML